MVSRRWLKVAMWVVGVLGSSALVMLVGLVFGLGAAPNTAHLGIHIGNAIWGLRIGLILAALLWLGLGRSRWINAHTRTECLACGSAAHEGTACSMCGLDLRPGLKDLPFSVQWLLVALAVLLVGLQVNFFSESFWIAAGVVGVPMLALVIYIGGSSPPRGP